MNNLLKLKAKAMNTLNSMLFILMIILTLFSCEKEEDKDKKSFRSYLDYNKFVKEGLVAYYPFNGDTKDYSGNGLTGKANEIDYGTDRFENQMGSCLFNGKTSFVEIENSELLKDDEYTICFWYRANLSDTLEHAVLSKSDSSGLGFHFSIFQSGYFSHLGFYEKDIIHQLVEWTNLDPSIHSSSLGNEYEFAAISFTENELINHISGYKTYSKDHFYINNKNCNLLIGKNINSKIELYSGEIDDLLIYNRVLSIDEVQLLYDWNNF